MCVVNATDKLYVWGKKDVKCMGYVIFYLFKPSLDEFK